MDTQSTQAAPTAVEAVAVEVRSKVSAYPAPFLPRVAGRRKRVLGDLFGLRSFGVNGAVAWIRPVALQVGPSRRIHLDGVDAPRRHLNRVYFEKRSFSSSGSSRSLTERRSATAQGA